MRWILGFFAGFLGFFAICGQALQASTLHEKFPRDTNRRHSVSSNNATCSSGACGDYNHDLGVEYEISIHEAKLLSEARSMKEVLAIFGKHDVEIDEEIIQPTRLDDFQTTPGKLFRGGVSSQRLGAAGSPVKQKPGDFGRHSGIQLAENAGCMPERVTVPIEVPDDALESRHYHLVPTCTRIERCGGCCNHELLSCQPMQKETVTMNILAIPMMSSMNPKPLKIPVQVEKHTMCACDCITKPSDCSQFHEHKDCKCVCKNREDEEICLADPNRIWYPKTCHCACKHPKPCATGHFFHPIHCRCEEMTFDENNNFVFQSYRNRGHMLVAPSPTTEALERTSPETSTAGPPTRATIGRFWLTAANTATTPKPTTAPSTTAPRTTTTSTTAATRTRPAGPRSMMDNTANAAPPRSRQHQQLDTPTRYRTSPSLDDVDDDQSSFSRHKQVTAVNIPALKAWKISSFDTLGSTGSNALDTTTFDYPDLDDGDDGFSPTITNSNSNRKSRLHDPNKDIIRHNIAAFKKGMKKIN